MSSVWTFEQPKVCGYYWFKGDGRIEVVKILTNTDGTVYAQLSSGHRVDLEHLTGEWAYVEPPMPSINNTGNGV